MNVSGEWSGTYADFRKRDQATLEQLWEEAGPYSKFGRREIAEELFRREIAAQTATIRRLTWAIFFVTLASVCIVLVSTGT